jgi:hypothetical protein
MKMVFYSYSAVVVMTRDSRVVKISCAASPAREKKLCQQISGTFYTV